VREHGNWLVDKCHEKVLLLDIRNDNESDFLQNTTHYVAGRSAVYAHMMPVEVR
jgi:hypothetical protein